MSTRNMDILVAQILNTPPYQMPPVVHTGGTYQLIIKYRGVELNKTSSNLYDCMDGYLDFVIEVNDRHRFGEKDWNKLPRPYGSVTPVHYQNHSKLNQTG